MLFNFGYQSVLLLIFFFHGIVFSFLLLKKGIEQSNSADRWLSLFVFLCSMYIVPWMCGHAGWYAHDGYREFLFFVPFQQLLLIGPVLFFYTRSLLDKSFRFTRKSLYHLLPAILYLLYSLVVFVVDQLVLPDYYFYADGRDKDLAPWYQVTGLLSMMFYLLLSIQQYFAYKKVIYDVVSYADAILLKWVKNYLFAFLLILIIRTVFFILFPEFGDFGSKWWYYVFFSLLFYYISISGYVNTIRATVPLDFAFPAQKNPPILSKNKEEKIDRSTSPDQEKEQMEVLKVKLEALMTQEELFKNPKLTLPQIAEIMDSSPNEVSRLINKGFGMNFNDFVNHYRVEAVKKGLQENTHKTMTLLAIALDCGFNSKTTFNRVFKKTTGQTPRNYIDDLSRQQ